MMGHDFAQLTNLDLIRTYKFPHYLSQMFVYYSNNDDGLCLTQLTKDDFLAIISIHDISKIIEK